MSASDSVAASHLYVHVPFCIRKCDYCAFFSGTGHDAALLDRFVDALCVELERHPAPERWRTVYFGGGTPSLLGPGRVERLLRAISDRALLAEDVEITLEANPEAMDSAAAFGEAGVTRLSLGVQSFRDEDLRFLGRVHDADRAAAALGDAVASGLRVSLDLIYGLPGQDPEAWCRQLELAAASGAEHVSAYELTIEAGTPMARRLVDHQVDPGLFFMTHGRLSELGFQGYEVSSFAREPAAQSRHNLATWAHQPCLGLGPGAHSLLPGDPPVRRWNRHDLPGWLKAIENNTEPPHEQETLTIEQQLLERIMLGLRTRAGVDLRALRQDIGEPATALLLQRAAPSAEKGLLHLTPTHIQPTINGMALADSLTIELCC